MSKLRRFLDLTGWERRLFVEVLSLLIGVQVGLQISSFQAIRSSLDHLPNATLAGNRQPSNEAVVWAVDAASTFVPTPSTCLARAIVTETVLARRGQQSSLRISVAQEDSDKLTAHSWLVADGEIIVGDDADLEAYTELPPLDSR